MIALIYCKIIVNRFHPLGTTNGFRPSDLLKYYKTNQLTVVHSHKVLNNIHVCKHINTYGLKGRTSVAITRTGIDSYAATLRNELEIKKEKEREKWSLIY